MKRYAALLVMLLLAPCVLRAEVLSADPEATPKPIKITVEGLPDSKPTSLTTMKDVFFKNELFRPNTANSVATIKKMADAKNAMESEIIDAIITKLADMEEAAKAQQVLNTALLAAVAVLFVLCVFLMVRKRKL
jgi:hypothetical protein